MPLRWRLQVLEADIAPRFSGVVRFVEADLFGLSGRQRSAAIDALTKGSVLPFVIMDDQMVCSGKLDPDTIVAGIERIVAG